LGSGVGHFAGPMALTVGRTNGAASASVYVADSHSGRLVRLEDRGDHFDWADETRHTGAVTSLDTDHWGAVYASAPRQGAVTKFSADLDRVAALDSEARPRAFHVPFVNRTDHRDGSVQRIGQGSGLVVEEWTASSGIRMVRLGVEVRELAVRSESGVAADFLLTDRGAVRADFVDVAGRTVMSKELGAMNAGRHSVEFDDATLASLATGETSLRLTATSEYAGAEAGSAEAAFPWTGSVVSLPARAEVLGSTPNPFRQDTAIRFAVPAGESRFFSLKVYDITGRLVRTVDQGTASSGVHVRNWDGRDAGGNSAGAGVYLVRLSVNDESSTRKVVLLR
ncbi:MAG: T9SS type A sorting domain-containing protein, partial [Gemmatimonadetes bacterium]|nr:T9SS type A sorting domain-containing protein [Gemmatimonadota bacterium]